MAVGQCGDSIEVSLRIDQGAIADIRVAPHGCLYTLVCASAMSEMVKGRQLDQALELEPQELVSALGGLPEDHIHCARLAVNTLGEAIADYYQKTLQGEETMLRILLASARPEILQPFSDALSSVPQVRLQRVGSGADALDAVRVTPPDLVVIDIDLPDDQPLDLVSRLLTVNAMVNTAVVSGLPDAEFHEAAEGLGVLARLPVAPSRDDAVELLEKLHKVLGQVP